MLKTVFRIRLCSHSHYRINQIEEKIYSTPSSIFSNLWFLYFCRRQQLTAMLSLSSINDGVEGRQFVEWQGEQDQRTSGDCNSLSSAWEEGERRSIFGNFLCFVRSWVGEWDRCFKYIALFVFFSFLNKTTDLINKKQKCTWF